MPADKEPLVGLDEIARLLERQEGPPGARRRPASPRSARRWTGIVAAAALVVGSALGFGLGSSLTPSGNAAGPTGVGFVPSSGWRVLQSGGDATPLRPALAIASNVRLDPEDDARGIRTSSGLPYATLLGLPLHGVVIVATFTVPNGETPDPTFRELSLPLELRKATRFGQNSTQIRPARPLGEYELRAQVNDRDLVIHFYFGRSKPTDAMLTAAQRQLDGLVVQPARSASQVAERALPLRPETPAASTATAAAKVIDRTLACKTGYKAGALLLLATARAQGVTQQQRNLASAYVTTPADPLPTSQNFEPTLAGVTAGSRRPGMGSGGLGIDAKLCKATRAAVAFSPKGLSGGFAPSYGLDAQCFPAKTVLVRVRAVFRRPVTLKLAGKGAFYQAIGYVEKGEIMVRSTAGRPLVYADVADSGRARLFTAKDCF
jgi:hypothetical protein